MSKLDNAVRLICFRAKGTLQVVESVFFILSKGTHLFYEKPLNTVLSFK